MNFSVLNDNGKLYTSHTISVGRNSWKKVTIANSEPQADAITI